MEVIIFFLNYQFFPDSQKKPIPLIYHKEIPHIIRRTELYVLLHIYVLDSHWIASIPYNVHLTLCNLDKCHLLFSYILHNILRMQ